MNDYRIKAIRFILMVLSYVLAVLSVVMILEDNISKPERGFYMLLWIIMCRVGDKIRKEIKEVKDKDEDIR